MGQVVSDVRYAVRSLWRRRGFAVLTIAILALGIGANTAIFSVVNAVLLRSLPYRDADELVVVWADGTARGMSSRLPTTPGTFLDWREQSRAFTGLAALRNDSRRITSAKEPVVPLVHGVTANYFDVLGVQPRLGRGFRPGEDGPGQDGVVILSHATWQGVFGGDPGIVGGTISLDDRPYTVVGVMGPDFYTAHVIAVQPALWIPLPLEVEREDRATRNLVAYARLAPSRSLAAAQAEMDAVSARLVETHPDTDDKWGAGLMPLREHTVGRFSDTFGILLAAVALVLLIAGANVANLTLARAAERGREIALRSALGARRSRIVGQLVTESLVVALAGGLAGAAVASLAVGPMARLIPIGAGVPFLEEVRVDERVLLFTLTVSLVIGVVIGLVPARQASRPDLNRAFRDGRAGPLGGPRQRLRQALVVGEVALAVVVVVAAGLLVQTFARLRGYAPGFDADRILKLRTSLRGEQFAGPEARIAHMRELQRRLAALPGAASASAVSFEPPVLEGVFGSVRIDFPDRPASRRDAPSAVRRVALPGYFETMGMPVVSGRSLSEEDGAPSRPVAVISAEMARRYFSDRDPLGRTFAVDAARPLPLEIVGVVGDVMTSGTRPEPMPAFYVPYAQDPLSVMSFVVRVPAGDPLAAGPAAEKAAWALSGSTNVYGVETLDRRIADLNWRSRFGALLLGGFAAVALLLGTAGIYAVISYSVAQRRAEIGVRMALGARPGAVLGLVLGDALRLALVGVALGALGALAVTRVLAGSLYGVTAADPTTFAAVMALLLGVAAAAGIVPAVRATQIDPLQALKH